MEAVAAAGKSPIQIHFQQQRRQRFIYLLLDRLI